VTAAFDVEADRRAEMEELSELVLSAKIGRGRLDDAAAPQRGWVSDATWREVAACPIPVVLHCPACGMQHVDSLFAKPHAQHDCAGCRHRWTPHPAPTLGTLRAPRLGYREWLTAWRFLKVDPRWVNAMPAMAVLVGEAPGPRTRGDMPLFPNPPGSAGARLHLMSRLSAPDYLAAFARVNLLPEYPGHAWPAHSATQAAEVLLAHPPADRVVMLGTRVACALGAGLWPLGEWQSFRPGLLGVRLPHPSGKNLLNNDPRTRDLIAQVMKEACS